jgi:hypothetical protein
MQPSAPPAKQPLSRCRAPRETLATRLGPDVCAVARERRVDGDDREVVEQRLRDEEPIERVAVMTRQTRHGKRVF